MVIFVVFCNIGGLSGSANVIPLMLIFMNMTMTKAVPVSMALSMFSTIVRFAINYKIKHPNNENKLLVNYDIIQTTMPIVFLGTLIGVQVASVIGPNWQAFSYGVTLSWAIYKTSKKAINIYKSEYPVVPKEIQMSNV